MNGSGRVDFADGEVDGGLLGDQDVRLVRRLPPDHDHQAKKKFVMRSNSG